MIEKLLGYGYPNIRKFPNPPFKAHMTKGAYIPVKVRPSQQTALLRFLQRVEDTFFEIFPKLDPEYKIFIKEA